MWLYFVLCGLVAVAFLIASHMEAKKLRDEQEESRWWPWT